MHAHVKADPFQGHVPPKYFLCSYSAQNCLICHVPLALYVSVSFSVCVSVNHSLITDAAHPAIS